MNRLQLYFVTLAICFIAFVLNAFGNYTFTLVEFAFFTSSILMVFNFERKQTNIEEKSLSKPQIFQYKSNRLNLYNYLGAMNVALFIILYLLIKYVDTPRAGVYIFVAWLAAGYCFSRIYRLSSERLFKENLTNYLASEASTSPLLGSIKYETLEEFIKFIDQNPKKNSKEITIEFSKSTNIDIRKVDLLYSIAQSYLDLVLDPIKTGELPE